ncbi:MAG: cytochrome c [Crocinitomicaceae bacterium]|nr:cytochrome c [Crocinitomicaceae bacterium]
MSKKSFVSISALLGLACVYGFIWPFHEGKFELADKPKNNSEKSLEEALLELGDDKAIHYLGAFDPDSAKMGEEMVKFGRIQDGSNKRISKFFVCTDCHNIQPESADPGDESPEAVLEYGMQNDVPFLPASTFYGMYNKKHWYNGDYDKKYGELVAPTRDTLENAIQLCAVQCSQGRPMERWEIRAVLHYYKSLEIQVSDLNFTDAELDEFERLVASNKEQALEMLRTKYNPINDAKFASTDLPEIEGYQPILAHGEYIYNAGCLHCHAVGREITNFDLMDDKLSYKFLAKRIHDHSTFAVPYITRKGTYAVSGRRQYMPQYSLQKMSQEQMLDLVAFIMSKAKE